MESSGAIEIYMCEYTSVNSLTPIKPIPYLAKNIP